MHASEDGASLVEYALLIALIAIAVIGSMQGFSKALYGIYLQIAQALNGG